MATGDQGDFTSRILRLLPTGWFPASASRLNAVLQGAASSLSAAFTMIRFVKAQTRVQTASASFLDLISRGYFGGALPRLQYESDSAYASRIEYNLTAPRGTRDGMMEMLEQLTGNRPIIFQPNRPADCLCMACLADIATAGNGSPLASVSTGGFAPPYPCFGYQIPDGVPVAAWGTLAMPCQVFIIIAPPVTGPAIYTGYAGFGSLALPSGGGGTGALVTLGSPDAEGFGLPLVYPDALPGEVTDSFIYQQISNWMPVGYSAWVLISNQGIY